ncbi:MAG: hypothetical protein ABR601_03340 [Parasphingopyxis sp.]|nr:hypothetical protein [Sphingomonadales bacterium]
MSRGLFLFGLWCLIVAAGFAYASFAGYSPFADGQRASADRGPGGVIIGRGPRGK